MTTNVELHEERRPDERSAEVVAGGSIAEAIVGAGGLVLAILGLAGAEPFYMAAIATIALGAALLFEGGALASRYSRIMAETSSGERTTQVELGGGMTAEALAGVAGIALGILALLGLIPMTLMAIAVLVFGAGLLIGSGATQRLNQLAVDTRVVRARTRELLHEVVSAAAGTQVLVGLAAVVLGILALLGTSPLPLTLVALLCVGAATVMSGSAVGGKMLGFLRH